MFNICCNSKRVQSHLINRSINPSSNKTISKFLCASALMMSAVVSTSYANYDGYDHVTEEEAYDVLTGILHNRPIRIYGTNDSWGSYMYVHFKDGTVKERWVGNQCQDEYIEVSREEYSNIASIKWQQGTQFSYQAIRPYNPPQEKETIFAVFLNDHGVQTLRGGTHREFEESIDLIGEVVLTGCKNKLTAKPYQGAYVTISQLEGLAYNSELKRVAYWAELSASYYYRKALRMRNEYEGREDQ